MVLSKMYKEKSPLICTNSQNWFNIMPGCTAKYAAGVMMVNTENRFDKLSSDYSWVSICFAVRKIWIHLFSILIR